MKYKNTIKKEAVKTTASSITHLPVRYEIFKSLSNDDYVL